MKKKKSLFFRSSCFFKIFLSILPLFSMGWANSVLRNHDFQLWLFDSFSNPINERSKFLVESEFRYGDHGSTLYYAYLQGKLLYSLNELVDVALVYRQLFNLRENEEILESGIRGNLRKWVPVFVPYGEFYLNFKEWGWKFIDRQRAMYYIYEDAKNEWVYRNRLMVIAPWQIGTMKFTPAIYDEVFFGGLRGFFENRFGVGGTLPAGDTLQLNLYYVLRNVEVSNSWRVQNVLVLQANF